MKLQKRIAEESLAVDSTDLNDLAVSTTNGPKGAVVVSRFGDHKWDFWPYIPHENRPNGNKVINWAVRLSNEELLTDPRHERLLISAKRFIWSLYTQPIDGAKRPSMTSVIHRFFEMVPLLRWMVSQGMDQFRMLDGHTLRYVAVAHVGSKGVRDVAGAGVYRRLTVLEAIHQQRNKIPDAIQKHPWPGESSGSLSGARIERKPKTELIPDDVLMPLARIAIEYVLDRAEFLFASRRELEKVTAAEQHRHPVHATIARKKAARQLGFAGQDDLTSELIRLRTACYIVINLFAGLRDSEMMSLSDCSVVEGTTRDGVSVLWLHGTIYKTGVRNKRWLVPPIVRNAVTVLTELTKALSCKVNAELEEAQGSRRKLTAEAAKRLSTLNMCKGKLFLGLGPGQRSVQVVTGATMSDNLKEFCRHHSVLGKDGAPYSLYAHQFRRTYAHYVARSELGDLLMLKEHFGHWSLDMTLLYADGAADEYETDIELLEWIAKEKQARQREILTQVANSATKIGSRSDWLTGWRRKVKTAASKEKLVAEMSDSITLNGTGHSWCVGNAKGTGCGGLCVFEADMCVDCKFGIITSEHLPVWKGIRDQQLEVLQMADLGIPGQSRAKAILIKADKVLNRLSHKDVHGESVKK